MFKNIGRAVLDNMAVKAARNGLEKLTNNSLNYQAHHVEKLANFDKTLIDNRNSHADNLSKIQKSILSKDPSHPISALDREDFNAIAENFQSYKNTSLNTEFGKSNFLEAIHDRILEKSNGDLMSALHGDQLFEEMSVRLDKALDREILETINFSIDDALENQALAVRKVPEQFIFDHDYEYSHALSENANGFMASIDSYTFNGKKLPRATKKMIIKSFEAVKGNVEAEREIITMALSNSDHLSVTSETGDIPPSVHVGAIGQLVRNNIRAAKMIFEGVDHELLNDLKNSNKKRYKKAVEDHQLDPKRLSLYYTLTKNLFSERVTRKQRLRYIYDTLDKAKESNTDPFTLLLNNVEQYPQFARDKYSMRKDVNPSNAEFKEPLDKKALKKLKEEDKKIDDFKKKALLSEELTKLAKVNPDDGVINSSLKILNYISKNYDTTLHKAENTYLAPILTRLTKLALRVREMHPEWVDTDIFKYLEDNVISHVVDKSFDNITDSKLRVEALKIHDTLLKAQSELNQEIYSRTGIKDFYKDSTYLAQTWSAGEMHDYIRTREGIALNTKIPEDVFRKAQEELAQKFFPLLDLEEMKITEEKREHLRTPDKFQKANKGKTRLQYVSEYFATDARDRESYLEREKEALIKEVMSNPFDVYSQLKDRLVTGRRGKALLQGFKKEFTELQQALDEGSVIDLASQDALSADLDSGAGGIKNELTKLLDEAITVLFKDLTTPFTFEDTKGVIENMLMSEPLATKASKPTDTSSELADRLLGSQKLLHFKTPSSIKQLIPDFTHFDGLTSLLHYSLRKQSKLLALLKAGFPRESKNSTLAMYAAYKQIRELTNKANNKLNPFMYLIGSVLNEIFAASPYREFRYPMKVLQVIDAASSVSSLGNMATSIMSSDSMGFAFATNNGSFKDFISKLILYFTNLKKDIPASTLKAVNITTDKIKAMNLAEKDTPVDKAYRGLDKVFRISPLDLKARYLLHSTFLSYLAEAARDVEGIKKDNTAIQKLRGLGLRDDHIDWLRTHYDEIKYTDDLGHESINLNALEYVHPEAEEIVRILDEMAQKHIPASATISTALKRSAGNQFFALFSFALTNLLRFTGIPTEHMVNSGIYPLQRVLAGDTTKTYFAHEMKMAVAESFMYHFLTRLTRGEVPSITDQKTGELSAGQIRELLFTVLLDSPMFGLFGELVHGGLDGNINGLLGYRLLGSLASLLGAAKAVGDLTKGQFGKALNDSLTSVNTLMPIKNTPIIGFLYQRILLDGLRTLVYEDADKYFQSVNNHVKASGFRPLIPAGGLYIDGIKSRRKAKKNKEKARKKSEKKLINQKVAE